MHKVKCKKILYRKDHIKVATIRWIRLWSVMQCNAVQCCVPVLWYAKWAHTISLGLTTLSAWGSLHGLYSQPQIHWGACNALLWTSLQGSVVHLNELERSALHCSSVHLRTILSPWLDTKHTIASLQPPATAVNGRREKKSGYTAGLQILCFPQLFFCAGNFSNYCNFKKNYELKNLFDYNNIFFYKYKGDFKFIIMNF